MKKKGIGPFSFVDHCFLNESSSFVSSDEASVRQRAVSLLSEMEKTRRADKGKRQRIVLKDIFRIVLFNSRIATRSCLPEPVDNFFR